MEQRHSSRGDEFSTYYKYWFGIHECVTHLVGYTVRKRVKDNVGVCVPERRLKSHLGRVNKSCADEGRNCGLLVTMKSWRTQIAWLMRFCSRKSSSLMRESICWATKFPAVLLGNLFTNFFLPNNRPSKWPFVSVMTSIRPKSLNSHAWSTIL